MSGTCDVSYMYRYADPIAGHREAHLRKATRSGVKPARAKEQVNEIAEATQQITKSGRSHLLCNDNKYPIPLSTKDVIYALCISFALEKGNHNVTGDVWRTVVQRK